MRNFSFLAAAIAFATAVSCTGGASVSGVLEGASGGTVVLRELSGGSDTVKVSPAGAYKAHLKIEEPEFVYISRNGRQIASLLLFKGDRVKVSSDTLGHDLSIEGSPESEKLAGIDKDYADFSRAFSSAGEVAEKSKIYIDYYRSRVSYVLNNPKSLTSVQVLFQRTPVGTMPIFNQLTDALLFSTVADSLSAVYPSSRYVVSLRKEAELRKNRLDLDSRLRSATLQSFPEIELADNTGVQRKLSEVDGKVVMLYFWTATAGQNMFNAAALIPLYEQYHPKGFEIFAVSLDTDKTEWAAIVREQKLPWINVCDTRGGASPYAGTYNVTSVPYAFFILDGDIDAGASVTNEETLRAYLKQKLGK